MSKYINTILISTFVGSIIIAIAPNKGNYKKYIRYIVSLVSLLCIISPLAQILFDITSLKSNVKNYLDDLFISEKVEISNSLIINTGVEKISNGIKDAIVEKYNFNENEVFVELVVDKANINAIKIKEINVFLAGKASWSDANKIEAYLKDLIGGEINVKRR